MRISLHRNGGNDKREFAATSERILDSYGTAVGFNRQLAETQTKSKR